MQTVSLFELQEYIRRVLALNFQEAVWVTAEIGQVSRSRGHVFLDLVQKGQDPESAVVAQAPAVLWQRTYQQIFLAQGMLLEQVLQEGSEVRIQVEVDYHEQYGLKLVVRDLDPAYTLGQLELQRRNTIEALRAGGLLGRNKALPVPTVLQRIAVISSAGAAGFQDFREHLAQNRFGYTFFCQLFSSAVQGKNLEAEITAAFAAVERQADRFDAVVVIRGGGARMDLRGFDQPAVCQAAAMLPLPLFTGIGHDMDETVLDMVAFAALKTPTAVADFLIQHNLEFETKLLRLSEQFHSLAGYQLHNRTLELEKTEAALHWNAGLRLREARQALDLAEAGLPALVRLQLNRAAAALDQAEALCAALAPEAAFRRGFSLTMSQGALVRSVQDLKEGDTIETFVQDGVIAAKTVQLRPGNKGEDQ
ncbi:MAG: exodeoxyribonuclease VII large subunit [Bacteroidetes bacterium]|nr:MAG: exodeoxyribonuclease VII large subunit [Bacteroidota bacterium]